MVSIINSPKENQIVFNKNVYSIKAIKRVLANYTDDLFFKLNENDKDFIVDIEIKNTSKDTTLLLKNIQNEVLEEDIRINIENETQELRELIFKKATNI